MPESEAWTVSEAKVKLSEVMRLAHEEGPQVVGRQQRQACVIVSQEQWQELQGREKEPFLDWVARVSPGIDFPLPDRTDDPDRPVPFADHV